MARESVLDLSFATKDLAAKIEAWQVLPSTGSDHYGILFAVKARNPMLLPSAQPRFNTAKGDWKLFAKTVEKETSNSSILQDLHNVPSPTQQDSKLLVQGLKQELVTKLDRIAEELTRVISTGAKAAFPLVSLRPNAKPWWSPTLQLLRTQMLQKQRNY